MAGFQEKYQKSNKHGGSNKACGWEKVAQKNKIFCTLIREVKVVQQATTKIRQALTPPYDDSYMEMNFLI